MEAGRLNKLIDHEWSIGDADIHQKRAASRLRHITPSATILLLSFKWPQISTAMIPCRILVFLPYMIIVDVGVIDADVSTAAPEEPRQLATRAWHASTTARHAS